MNARPLAPVLACLLAFATSGVSEAQTRAYPVQAVKAAFLYRFVDYAEWPAGRPPDRALTIAVLGDEQVAEELLRSVQTRKSPDRAITVLNVSELGEARNADIVFVAHGSARELRSASAEFANRPVLVVTEEEEGLSAGAVINFLVVEGRVRFEVSLPAAERRGLKLSSRLLSVALRVEKSGHLDGPAAEWVVRLLEKSRLRRFFRTSPGFAAAKSVVFAACSGA
jgi:hypothetical protein